MRVADFRRGNEAAAYRPCYHRSPRPLAAARVFITLSCVLSGRLALAQPVDAAAARAQLQQGYDLKQQGHCAEAIPHFEESARLDRKPKALLNLGDCEASLGRLSAAQSHYVEARDLARTDGDALLPIAEQRLADVDKRLPRLTIKLAPGAQGQVTVLRDGVELGMVSLNVALPADPGKHRVTVRGSGLERLYEVDLVEGQTRELEVTFDGGQPLGESSKPAVPLSPPPVSQPEPSSPMPTRRVVAIALGGVGVAGLVVGSVFGARTASKNSEIRDACPATRCESDAAYASYQDLSDQAKTSRTISIASFVVAGAALGAGAFLFFAPSPGSASARTASPSAARLRFSPSIGRGEVSLAVGGRF